MMTPTEMHIDALMEKIEILRAENERLQFELINLSVEHPCYQLSKQLESENARYREALQSIHDDMSRTVDMKMDHVQEGVEDKAISTIVKATTINKLREALKGGE